MQKHKQLLKDLFGPQAIWRNGILESSHANARVVFLVGVESRGDWEFWCDDMRHFDEGKDFDAPRNGAFDLPNLSQQMDPAAGFDGSIRFDADPMKAAGFANMQDARDAFDRRASSIILEDYSRRGKALENKIRIIQIEVKDPGTK